MKRSLSQGIFKLFAQSGHVLVKIAKFKFLVVNLFIVNEITSRSQLKKFVKTFIEQIREQINAIDTQYLNARLIFPEYFRYPYRVVCIISERKGVAIEFKERIKDSNSWKIDVFIEKDKQIEDCVLPRLSDGDRAFFVINGEFTRIENVNLVTKEFYDKFKDFIDSLSNSTTITKENPSLFVRVDYGSVKLVNVGIGYTANDQSFVKKIKFLWLIATNSEDYFTEEKAKVHAMLELKRYLDALIPRIPIYLLIDVLGKFDELIHKDDVDEREVREFLKNHPYILWMGCDHIEPEPDILGKKPDFIIKTSDNRYIVVELESPRKRLFISGRYIPESSELKDARAQLEEYLRLIKNNILYLRQRYPDISVENVRGLLVIGLKTNMTKEEIERLNQLNSSLTDYEIVTYDEIVERYKAFLRNLGVKYGPFA